jgi:hypothetical protein
MADFAQRFHLSRPEKGFEISPWDPDDAKIYFGDKTLNRELQERIEAGYSLGKPPKIYLQGRWGAGKTHHLYHLKYVLETGGLGSEKKFIAPYLQIECDADTSFQYLHRKMLNALGLAVVKDAVSNFLMSQGSGRADAQKKMFGSQNLIVATQVLSIGDDQLAWRWLSGEMLSGGELKSLNVTSSLEDTSELVDVLVRIGRLLREQGTNVIFFIDEGEGLKNVTKPNAQFSWHDGFRNLADNMNNSIGFIMAIFVDNNNPSPGFINEDDILRRIGQKNILVLEPYSQAQQIVPFLQDLLKARIDFAEVQTFPNGSTKDSYPFEADALDLFVNELLHGAVSATPSKIIEGVSECAWKAHTLNEDIISVGVVQDVVPRVTAAI